MSRRRVAVAVAVAALLVLLSACGRGGESQQPRDGRAGLQLTGSLGGRQIAVSDGGPELVLDDCDPGDGADDDVCALARDVNGELFVLVFENPEVLVAGSELPVRGECGDRLACDAVRDAAVVRVQIGQARRVMATGGELRLTVADPREPRFAGTLRLVLPGGTLSGSFDLVPRPDPT